MSTPTVKGSQSPSSISKVRATQNPPPNRRGVKQVKLSGNELEEKKKTQRPPQKPVGAGHRGATIFPAAPSNTTTLQSNQTNQTAGAASNATAESAEEDLVGKPASMPPHN